MGRTSNQFTFRFSDDENQNLVAIAERFGISIPATWKEPKRPSVPALIRAIANGDLRLARNTRR